MKAERALFITTATSEPIENVHAWQHTFGDARHVVFDISKPINDSLILHQAMGYSPDIIFYTGANEAPGLPTPRTFRDLRKIAPTVILQGDFGDPPWWDKIKFYRAEQCFDLYVAMDGVPGSPVDLVTLTPFDPKRFEAPPVERTIHCGFAGNMPDRARFDLLKSQKLATDPRSEIIYGLGDLVTVRLRELNGAYADYIDFYRRCEMTINTSWAGSGTVHHMKGRLLEASFAYAAILEMAESPIAHWFPEGSYFTYSSIAEAKAVIEGVDKDEIHRRAKLFTAHALEHYSARKIYQSILDLL